MPVKVPYPAYDVRKIIDCLRNPSDDLFMVAAHRGMRFGGSGTENSLSATAAAARAGCECIEVDVQLTKDGRVVVWHDDGVGRVTDVAVPEGGNAYNPFTGQGFNPLVRDLNWEGCMENMNLKDEAGRVTKEKPLLLSTLLSFIRREGIHIVVLLDVKDGSVLDPCYEVVSRQTDASGLSAMHWCVFKVGIEFIKTPAELCDQHWYRTASSHGELVQYIPAFRPSMTRGMDLIRVAKLWEHFHGLVAFEIELRGTGGFLQELVDYVKSPRCSSRGMGLFQPTGDLPLDYYSGSVKMSWNDAPVRESILSDPAATRWQFHEGHPLTQSKHLLAPGESPADDDQREHLWWMLEQGYTWVIADNPDQLCEELERLGKRNVVKMLHT